MTTPTTTKARESIWEHEILESMDTMREQIKKCEGEHKQQVAYSTYCDMLTQVCFDCKKVRTHA